MLIAALVVMLPAFGGQYAVCTKKGGTAWTMDVARHIPAEAIAAERDKLAELTIDETKPDEVPQYGVVHVVNRRLSIEAANTKYLTFLWVSKEGEKLETIEGFDNIAETPPAPGPLSGSAAYWWNVTVLPVPASPETLQLHVVDTLKKEKCVFEISGKGKSGMSFVEWIH